MTLSRRLAVPFSFTAHAHDIFLEDHLLAHKLRAARFAVGISRFNRQHLAERIGPQSVGSMRIVHCGVSLPAFPYSPDGREPDRILAVGRLDHIKGFEHLVEACGVLARSGVPFRCDIVGSGPLEAALRARIERLGLAERVRLLGPQKQEVVRGLLQQAGIFALPSVVTPRGDRDGIPVALMEAMASGAPVVSTRVSGIPELVDHEATGLLARPADAADFAACLERLLRDPALARRLAERARRHVEEEFEIGKETRKLYDAIAQSA
jgi:glycosyltransferase involved in cell wall biosynthesis